MQTAVLLPGGGLATDPWSVLCVGLGLLAMLAATEGPDLGARLPRPVVVELVARRRVRRPTT